VRKVFEANTLALDFGGKAAGLNVAVRPKPDWLVAELIISKVSRVWVHPPRARRPALPQLDDWNGTELICVGGHGLLLSPEIATSWFGTQRWLYSTPSGKSYSPKET